MADRQGFEPWMGYSPMPVFKTGAFNRSAICPHEESLNGKISDTQPNESKRVRKVFLL